MEQAGQGVAAATGDGRGWFGRNGGAFVRRRVDAGETAFVEMWERMGCQERYDLSRRWFAEHHDRFAEALAIAPN